MGPLKVEVKYVELTIVYEPVQVLPANVVTVATAVETVATVVILRMRLLR